MKNIYKIILTGLFISFSSLTFAQSYTTKDGYVCQIRLQKASTKNKKGPASEKITSLGIQKIQKVT